MAERHKAGAGMTGIAARWFVTIALLATPLYVSANGAQLECVIPGAAASADSRGATSAQQSDSAGTQGRMPIFSARGDRSDKRPDFSMVFCADAQGGASAGSTSDLERSTRRCLF